MCTLRNALYYSGKLKAHNLLAHSVSRITVSVTDVHANFTNRPRSRGRFANILTETFSQFYASPHERHDKDKLRKVYAYEFLQLDLIARESNREEEIQLRNERIPP